MVNSSSFLFSPLPPALYPNDCLLFVRHIFGDLWLGSTAACLASGDGAVTATALASLAAASLIPVGDTDGGNTRVWVLAGWRLSAPAF